MRVFGAHVPMSGWTLFALGAGVLVSLLVARPLARRTGRPAGLVLTTLLLACATLSLTLTPDGPEAPGGLRACLPDTFSDLLHTAFHTGGGLAGNALNLLLLFPLTTAITVTTRRIVASAVVALVLAPVIEAVQSQLPGRMCSVSDLITNTLGALAGVLVGYLVLRRR
ncbi:VanZ family protein [Amycolatopsis jejuensis]|uniref:VanZ family protein n=1 Tax=Amycolatopsis jejuensis TaxID=330084 RepID=UPI0005266716|nr:VanZ family protein [Amycolatopsis jejuensis]